MRILIEYNMKYCTRKLEAVQLLVVAALCVAKAEKLKRYLLFMVR